MIEIAGEVIIKSTCYLGYRLQAVVIIAHHHRVCSCIDAV